MYSHAGHQRGRSGHRSGHRQHYFGSSQGDYTAVTATPSYYAAEAARGLAAGHTTGMNALRWPNCYLVCLRVSLGLWALLFTETVAHCHQQGPATRLPMQASDRERRGSLRTQVLPASLHVVRNAPVVKPIHQHTDDKILEHSDRSGAQRSLSEEVSEQVPEETASSEKVQMVILSL